jgi:hypothetical protein
MVIGDAIFFGAMVRRSVVLHSSNFIRTTEFEYIITWGGGGENFRMVGLGIKLPQKKRYQLYFRSISILGSTSITWVLASRYSQAKIEVGTKRMKIITKCRREERTNFLGNSLLMLHLRAIMYILSKYTYTLDCLLIHKHYLACS